MRTLSLTGPGTARPRDVRGSLIRLRLCRRQRCCWELQRDGTGLERTVVVELLDAVVEGVADEEVPAPIDGDLYGVGELFVPTCCQVTLQVSLRGLTKQHARDLASSSPHTVSLPPPGDGDPESRLRAS